MQVRPASEAVGAFIDDIDLAHATDAEIDELRPLWAERGVLFFRNQDLGPDDHVALAEQLGGIDVNRFFKAVEGYDVIAEVRKDAGDELNIGGAWHTDHSYDPEPAMGSILVARDLPPAGGDTQFISTTKAWRTLPDALKARVAGLEAVHSSVHVYGEGGFYEEVMGDRIGNQSAVNTSTHPLVAAHPLTGAPILYVNPAFTIGIVGMEDDEARELLQTLFRHIRADEHMYQFSWEPGSVAMWDNRCTWHNALNDYAGHRRVMHRITLEGGPLAAAELTAA